MTMVMGMMVMRVMMMMMRMYNVEKISEKHSWIFFLVTPCVASVARTSLTTDRDSVPMNIRCQ